MRKFLFWTDIKPATVIHQWEANGESDPAAVERLKWNGKLEYVYLAFKAYFSLFINVWREKFSG